MDMEERLEPEFLKFVKGEVIEGVLIQVKRIQVANPDRPDGPKNPATRYTCLDDEGKPFCFLGCYQIDVKLRPTDIGRAIRLTYIGDDTNVGRNGNQMKVFEVMVSKQKAPEDMTFITDEDIPF